MAHQHGIKDQNRTDYKEQSVETPIKVILPLRPAIRILICSKSTRKREYNNSDSEPHSYNTKPLVLSEPVYLRVLFLFLFITHNFPVLEKVPIEKSQKNSGALALLFGIWFVEYIRKHVIVLDGERTSLEIIHMAHH